MSTETRPGDALPDVVAKEQVSPEVKELIDQLRTALQADPAVAEKLRVFLATLSNESNDPTKAMDEISTLFSADGSREEIRRLLAELTIACGPDAERLMARIEEALTPEVETMLPTQSPPSPPVAESPAEHAPAATIETQKPPEIESSLPEGVLSLEYIKEHLPEVYREYVRLGTEAEKSVKAFGRYLLDFAQKKREKKHAEDPIFAGETRKRYMDYGNPTLKRNMAERKLRGISHAPEFVEKEELITDMRTGTISYLTLPYDRFHHRPWEELFAFGLNLAKFPTKIERRHVNEWPGGETSPMIDKIIPQEFENLYFAPSGYDFTRSVKLFSEEKPGYVPADVAKFYFEVRNGFTAGEQFAHFFNLESIIRQYFLDPNEPGAYRPDFLEYIEPIQKLADFLSKLGISIRKVPYFKTEDECLKERDHVIFHYQAPDGLRSTLPIWKRIKERLLDKNELRTVILPLARGFSCVYHDQEGIYMPPFTGAVTILNPSEWDRDLENYYAQIY